MPYTPVIPLNGYWMDLRSAADHADVHLADIIGAVSRSELYSLDDVHGRPGVRMLEVEDWAKRRARLAG
jgi:hypothetical protein